MPPFPPRRPLSKKALQSQPLFVRSYPASFRGRAGEKALRGFPSPPAGSWAGTSPSARTVHPTGVLHQAQPPHLPSPAGCPPADRLRNPPGVRGQTPPPPSCAPRDRGCVQCVCFRVVLVKHNGEQERGSPPSAFPFPSSGPEGWVFHTPEVSPRRRVKTLALGFRERRAPTLKGCGFQDTSRRRRQGSWRAQQGSRDTQGPLPTALGPHAATCPRWLTAPAGCCHGAGLPTSPSKQPHCVSLSRCSQEDGGLRKVQLSPQL